MFMLWALVVLSVVYIKEPMIDKGPKKPLKPPSVSGKYLKRPAADFDYFKAKWKPFVHRCPLAYLYTIGRQQWSQRKPKRPHILSGRYFIDYWVDLSWFKPHGSPLAINVQWFIRFTLGLHQRSQKGPQNATIPVRNIRRRLVGRFS